MDALRRSSGGPGPAGSTAGPDGDRDRARRPTTDEGRPPMRGRPSWLGPVSRRELSAGVSAIVVERRLDTTTAADDDRRRDERDGQPQRRRGRLADREGDDGRRDQHRDQVHHLDQRVDRRAGGVLERVADGVADDGGLVRGRALAAVVAVLDQLLRVVPRATGVGQEDRHQGAGRRWRRPGSRPAGRRRGRSRPRSGRRSASRPGVASSRSESRVQMSTTRPYSGRTVPSMIPGFSRNWRRTSNTIGAGRAGHRVDGQPGEHEHHRGADDHADQGVRGEHLAGERGAGVAERPRRRRPARC